MDELKNLTGREIPESDGVTPVFDPTTIPKGVNPNFGNTPKPAAEPTDEDTPVVIPEAPVMVPTQTAPKVPSPVPPAPKDAPKPFVGHGMTFMSPEEAKGYGIAQEGERVDVQAEQFREAQEKYAKVQADKAKEMQSIFEGVLGEEEARLQRLDNTLKADPETREKLLGETPTASVSTGSITYEDREKADRLSGNPAVDPFDLMPSYDESEAEENNEPKAEEKAPDPGDEEYGKYIREMDVAEVPHSDAPAVRTIRESMVEVTDSGRNGKNSQPLGDQAFLNAITKFKKDKFGKVTVLLPNSGFFCDVVGTGVVDLTNLYMNVDQNMSTYDYQLEQMRVVIKNVVGTNPKINPANLQNMIHFQDFNMLAFGHICATMKSIETVTNCTECGKPFRITSRPNDLIINMADFSERWAQIENAPNVEAYSLMTRNRTVHTSINIDVILGHPSYAEIIRCIRGYQHYVQDMTAADAHRFESMLQLLYMIRRIKLPNGVSSNNIHQNYLALMLLSQEDLDLVNREATAMRNEIMVPKFGIKEVTCPHCHQTVRDIAFDGLLDLLFYHTTISSYLNNPES